jgi:hypothetical protein
MKLKKTKDCTHIKLKTRLVVEVGKICSKRWITLFPDFKRMILLLIFRSVADLLKFKIVQKLQYRK